MKHPLHLCRWCAEIQQERSSIHEFDGGATQAQADALASVERCPEHRREKKVLAVECDLI